MHFASMDDVFCEPTVVVHSSQTDHTNIAIAVSKKSQLHRFGFPSLSNMKVNKIFDHKELLFGLFLSCTKNEIEEIQDQAHQNHDKQSSFNEM